MHKCQWDKIIQAVLSVHPAAVVGVAAAAAVVVAAVDLKSVMMWLG